MTVRAIRILYDTRVDRARRLAEEVGTWAGRQGQQVQVCTTEEAWDTLCLQDTDLLLTLGGDGLILHAARLAAPFDTLILGINLGRVGFLTEAEPDGWRDVLSLVLDGHYWVEERMMLRALAWRGGELVTQVDALNDVVVGRGARGRAIHLRTQVEGGDLTTYVADGLIVATPTGSTAYAMAAGGPILPPQLRNILLVPVAPHLSMERPIVLAEGVTVRITVLGDRPAVLTVDGQVKADLVDSDTLLVKASSSVTRFARVCEETYFYKTLVSRLVPRNNW